MWNARLDGTHTPLAGALPVENHRRMLAHARVAGWDLPVDGKKQGKKEEQEKAKDLLRLGLTTVEAHLTSSISEKWLVSGCIFVALTLPLSL